MTSYWPRRQRTEPCADPCAEPCADGRAEQRDARRAKPGAAGRAEACADRRAEACADRRAEPCADRRAESCADRRAESCADRRAEACADWRAYRCADQCTARPTVQRTADGTHRSDADARAVPHAEVDGRPEPEAHPAAPAGEACRARVDVDRGVGAGNNIEGSALGQRSHVTNVEQHIHLAPDMRAEASQMRDFVVDLIEALQQAARPAVDAELADLRQLAARLAALADRLTALEREQAAHSATHAELRQETAEYAAELAHHADRLTVLERRLADLEERHTGLLAANALLHRQRDAAYASAAASETDHREERQRREAAEAARQDAERREAAVRARADQYAAERDAARGRLAARPAPGSSEPASSGPSTNRPAHMSRPAERCGSRLNRTHTTYTMFTWMPTGTRACSPRWCSLCFRERHGRWLGSLVGFASILSCVPIGVGLYWAGAPGWTGVLTVIGMLGTTPFLVEWINQSPPTAASNSGGTSQDDSIGMWHGM